MSEIKSIKHSAGAVAPNHIRPLVQGDTGKDVTALQTRLKELGFDPGAIDGKMGKNTVAALKDFQRSQGLPEDGKVGPMTRVALATPKNLVTLNGGDVVDLTKLKPQPNVIDDLMNYQVSEKVGTDLEKASHDWTSGGFYNDIRHTLGEAETKADFAKIAEAARGGRLTAQHADTIAAIGTADTKAVRDALRDAYADPRKNATQRLADADNLATTDADRAAIAKVRVKLESEHLL